MSLQLVLSELKKGDVARYPYHLTGEQVRIEHWNVAQNQGRTVAGVIMALNSEQNETLPIFKQIPYFWTVQFGKSIRYVGHATSYDDVIVQVMFISCRDLRISMQLVVVCLLLYFTLAKAKL